MAETPPPVPTVEEQSKADFDVIKASIKLSGNNKLDAAVLDVFEKAYLGSSYFRQQANSRFLANEEPPVDPVTGLKQQLANGTSSREECIL